MGDRPGLPSAEMGRELEKGTLMSVAEQSRLLRGLLELFDQQTRRTEAGIGEPPRMENAPPRFPLLSWLVYDTLFVDFGPECDTLTAERVAEILGQRMPRNRWGHTPLSTMWCLLLSFPRSDGAPQIAEIEEHPTSIYRNRTHVGQRVIDWGVDNLVLDATRVESCREMMDEVVESLNIDICQRLGSQCRNRLRLRHSGRPCFDCSKHWVALLLRFRATKRG